MIGDFTVDQERGAPRLDLKLTDARPSENQSEKPNASGLPLIGPDEAEERQGDELDDIVPSQGFHTLPVVGLGGSAGGITALRGFFESTPAQTGLAYVVILHLAPDHHSILAELLQRHCAMPVQAAEDAVTLEADNVYVIPPGKHLTTVDGHLRLTDLQPQHGKRVAVDLFFRSLADTHGPHAVGIVLSGADSDGTLGLKRIKERGGLTIAQDPGEAEQASMPQSAIATGMVDWVLKVEEMPQRIVAYRARERRLEIPPKGDPQSGRLEATPPDRETLLREILSFLRTRTGRDFSYYKRATIVRRITRRMQVSGVESFADYMQVLRTQPGEAAALVADLLITVTNFFRDRESFEVLNSHIEALFQEKRPEDSFRVWVPGCATGEEAYSIAMLLLEHARKLASAPMLQVFGCDLDDEAIHFARVGLYPETIAADVSEERLLRFFTKSQGGYLVRREVREIVLFTPHDLLKDAPFSRIDVLSCRNLLIYVNRDAQARCFEIFNFSLNPGAILFLGSSETVPDGSTLFAALDTKHRIYRQRPVPRVGLPVPRGSGDGALARVWQQHERLNIAAPTLPGSAFVAHRIPHLVRVGSEPSNLPTAHELYFRLLGPWGHPSALVNAEYDIVLLSENASRFLQMPGGEPTNNLLRLTRPSLRAVLRCALLNAEQRGEAVEVPRSTVELPAGPAVIDLRVVPAGELAPGYFLVMFSGHEPLRIAEGQAMPVACNVEAEAVVQQLEQQLARADARLQATIEQYEVANEELKASNEELQAMNEELRSAGEELETGREELQSVNEELSTLNAEFKSRVEELSRANSDLHNLMSATQIATVFLDRRLHIMRYTPSAVPLFNFISADIGRPISDLKQRLEYPELAGDAEQVLRTLLPVEREMRGSDNRWLLARVLPYRTVDDYIAGVVLTFIDITERRSFEGALRASEQRLQTLADAVPQIIWTNDRDGRAVYFNRGWYEYTGRSTEESVGPGWQAIVHAEDMARAVAQWQRVLEAGEVFDCEYRLRGSDGTYRWFIGRNVPTRDADGQVDGWFGTATDIDDLKMAEASRRASEEQFRRAIEDAPIPVIMQAEDGQVLQISKAWTDLTGFRPEDIPNFEAWLNRAYGPGADEVRAHMQELFKGEVSVLNADLEVSTREGNRRHWIFSASAPGTLRDGRRFIVGMVSDITERRHAEEQLRQSQERLRLIVENARDFAIFSMDLERRITSWNTGARAILGYSNEEAIGRRGDIIFTPEDRAAGAPRAEADKALADGRASDERWHIRKDGSRFWGSGVMMAMRDGPGTAIGLVKIFRDQTAELRAKEAMEQARQQLHAALQETEIARDQAEAAGTVKDRFLAILSHELRAPLTPVLLGAQVIARDKTLPPAILQTASVIERNVRLQAHLIDDLLDVSRIKYGKMELSLERIDLHDVITRAVEVSHPDIEAKAQELKVQLAAARHTISGDAKRLQQGFWNLLNNASKFTPQGGKIMLRSRNERDRVVVEVCDTGVGFEPEAATRIFEVFEQGGPNVTAQYGGLGLGLAIAEASVKAHGGVITAASDGPGTGAKLTVELPLALQ